MSSLPGPSDPPPRKRTTLVYEVGILFLGASGASLLLAHTEVALGCFVAFLACDYFGRRR